MKLKKKEIDEIIDTNGELIGADNIPSVDANADTQANNTSDYNAKIGTQPFRYDMLGRFGFTLMPFMEGEDKNQGQAELENDIIDLLNERFVDILKYYYKNPQKLKSDYRKYSGDEELGEDVMKDNVVCADKLLKIIEKHFEEPFRNLDEHFKENLVESKVVEDKMVDKKDNEMASKSEDGEINDKKIEKIAGLINKLEKKDINKLMNLLEINNG